VACFRQATGDPHNPAPPTVDGILANDNGWTNAFRYAVYNGSNVTDVAWEAIRDDASQSLYLSFAVNNDGTFDAHDAILLTFSPDGIPAHDRRIQLFPFVQNVQPIGSVAPREIRYWEDSDHWNIAGNPANNPIVPTPSWLMNNTRLTAPTANTWLVEMRIPIVAGPTDPGINFPAAPTQFKMSVDFLVWHNEQNLPLTPTAEEFPWPTSSAGLTGGAYSIVSRNTAPVAQWSSGVLSDLNICNGVNLAWYDVAVVHPAGSALSGNQIAWNQANDFTVAAHNDAVDALGNYVPSNQVFAIFQIANWGIPSLASWNQVAVLPGPVTETPPKDIPAAAGATQGTATLILAGWTVPAGDVAKYQANPHQCVRTVLDAKAVGVTFKNTSTVTNMDFVQASSPFTDTATIGTRGYRVGEQRDSVEFTLTAYSYNAPPDSKWATSIAGMHEVRPGQFLLRASARQDARIGTSVLPPSIHIPSVDLHLPPQAGARAGGLRVPVKPGALVTLLASGSIRVRADSMQHRRTLSGADGVDLGEAAAQGDYPLPRQQRPWEKVGALVASWDGFQKSAFFVGSARTFKAPDRAEVLTLALNDTPEGLKQHTGEGYAVQVIATPVEPYFSYHNSVITRNFDYERSVVPLGSNLPTWVLCGRVKTGRKIEQDSVVADVVTTAGCYGSMLNRIGPTGQ
jgi:hypothetical protein